MLLVPSLTVAPSGFAMNLSRSFQVIGANRGHSFPPIWVNMTLVNLPSAVRRLARDRSPLATLTLDLGCLTTGVAFVSGTTRLFRGFTLVAFFLVFMLASLLGLSLTISLSLQEVNYREVLFLAYFGSFGFAVLPRTKAVPDAFQVVGST